MIIFWGFQDFLIYLAKYFWSPLKILLIWFFNYKQCKQNSLIS